MEKADYLNSNLILEQYLHWHIYPSEYSTHLVVQATSPQFQICWPTYRSSRFFRISSPWCLSMPFIPQANNVPKRRKRKRSSQSSKLSLPCSTKRKEDGQRWQSFPRKTFQKAPCVRQLQLTLLPARKFGSVECRWEEILSASLLNTGKFWTLHYLSRYLMKTKHHQEDKDSTLN